MSQGEALYRLQNVDLNIQQVQQRLKAIETALRDDLQVNEVKASVEKAQQTLAPLRTKNRNLELEIQANNSKRNTTEEQLYSGRVRNPKEMQDMQREIEALKNRHAELEDQLLSLMVEIEESETLLTSTEGQLEETQQRRIDEQSRLLAEQLELQAKLKTLQTQRSEALQYVTPESQKIYDAARARRMSQPIAMMKDANCTFCGVEQTTTVAQQVRQGQKLINCANCERILVYVG